MKNVIYTAMASSLLMSLQAQAAPSKPSIDWQPQEYSFVEVVIDGSGSYRQLVTAKSQVDISIKWNAWSGDGGDNYKVYFDDMVVNEGTLTAGTKSGTINFPYTKAGRHTLTIALCEGTVCERSDGKAIVIADTDGAHLQPLAMDVDPNNKTYTKPANTVVGAYFVEWGIYGRDFDVSNIPAHNLTHLLYGFIPICGPNESLKEIENGNSWRALQLACGGSQDYEVVIHDPWAAIQKTLPGISQNDPIRGTYAQLMALKQRYPDLKILPSVGGWTLSDPFYGFTTKANRDTFVASMKEFLQTWKFYDGVDIDWEFPGGDGANPNLGDRALDGQAYIDLMRELRAMLDELELETGRTYELTSAIGMGYDKIEDVDYAQAVQHMDYIFAMTYDFFGGWNNVTGHQTALYCGQHMSQGECDGTGVDDQGNPRKGPAYTADNGMQKLLGQGVPANKVVLGVAMYGRGWEGVTPDKVTGDNPMTAVASGKLTGSTAQGVWEPGIQDYKGLKTYMLGANGTGINGYEARYDEQAQGAYIWNPGNGKLVTYDSPRSVNTKGQYVRSQGLAGLFAWEIDADNGDILNAMHEGLASTDPINTPPTVQVPANVTVNEGQATTITAQASDIDNDVLTYLWTASAELSPTGTNTNALTIQAPQVNQDTDFVVSLAVSDGKATVNRSTTVTVKASVGPNTPPVVTPIADITIDESTSVTVTVSATDADGDVLSYNWNLPAGITKSGSGATVDLIAGSVSQTTNFPISVDVSDGTDTVTASFMLTVNNVVSTNNPPVVNPITDITMEELTSASVTVDATDPDGDSLTYSWNVPSGLTRSGNGAQISLAAGEVTADTTYSVSVTVSDGVNDVAENFTVFVTNKVTGGTDWDPGKIYNTGDEVMYNGVKYRARWWTQGDTPGVNEVWEEVIPVGTIPTWSATKAYNGGDKVKYGTAIYQARWWTRGEQPDVSSVWVEQ